MATFSVDHLHVICENLEEMIRFWTAGVGASFKEYRTFGGAQGAVVRLGDLQLNMRVPKENEKGEAAAQSVLGYNHLGLRVENLEAACAHLERFGCSVHSGPTELSDRRIAFLTGPEGITVELMQMF
jgi:catechol 2,3-dioxygenase-like lactoylglutathione lyase family enzyme